LLQDISDISAHFNQSVRQLAHFILLFHTAFRLHKVSLRQFVAKIHHGLQRPGDSPGDGPTKGGEQHTRHDEKHAHHHIGSLLVRRGIGVHLFRQRIIVLGKIAHMIRIRLHQRFDIPHILRIGFNILILH